jgi:hypothetical protein
MRGHEVIEQVADLDRPLELGVSGAPGIDRRELGRQVRW